MKKMLKVLTFVLLTACFTPFANVHAENAYAGTYIIDETNTLTDEELNALNQTAGTITENYQCGIYVVLTSDLEGYRESQYAQGEYMNHDLGYGDDASGILLAIAIDERYFNSVSYGSAGDVFTTSVQEGMQDDIIDYLAEDDWYGGAAAWIDECQQVLAEGGYSYHENQYSDPEINTHIVQTTPEERRKEWASELPFAAIAAIILSLIINFARKARLKTTGVKKEAVNYVKPGSMDLNIAQDYYAGTTRTVQRIPRNNSNGPSPSGGHSYHSSGFTSGGSGHHF